MKERYLEVTYRRGKILAAYLYLPRKTDDTSMRTQEIQPGLVIDFSADGRAIGVELTAPQLVTPEAINRALEQIGQEPMAAAEMTPLAAA